MELQHINVKIYVDGDLPVAAARFIEVFHKWIQEKTLGELLIDVADYGHVPAGPGVLLVGHEADYSMDHTDGRWGCRYNRKAPLEGSNQDRLRQAMCSVANACRLLEAHFAGGPLLKFSRREFEVFINDRALAPNTPETQAACRPEIEEFVKNTLGQRDFTLQPPTDLRRRFGLVVKLAAPFDLDAVLRACADSRGSQTSAGGTASPS